LSSSELDLKWTTTLLYHGKRESFGVRPPVFVSTATNVLRKTRSKSVPPADKD